MHWTKIKDGIWEGKKKTHCDTKFKIKGIVFVGKLLKNGKTEFIKTYEIQEVEEISYK